MNNDAIYEKAKELGELIRESEVKKRADETGKALLEDETAKGLIDNYNALREKKTEELKGQDLSKEQAQEVNDYFQAEFEKLAKNSIIKEYLDAARDYEMMLGQMDGILKHVIAGEQDSSCGGSCSTCGGCH